MSCDYPENAIIRFQYDDDPHTLLITVKDSDGVKTPLDLNLVDTVKFRFQKDASTVVEYDCAINSEPTTGLVEIPFAVGDVDTAGDFPFVVKVTWKATTKVRTVLKSTLYLQENI